MHFVSGKSLLLHVAAKFNCDIVEGFLMLLGFKDREQNSDFA